MPGLQLHRCPLCSTRCWTSWLGALAFVFPSLVRPSRPSEQIWAVSFLRVAFHTRPFLLPHSTL